MPADPDQLEALAQHDSNKKIGEIPYFHGIPSKDLLTAKQTILKIETAAPICGWNDAAKAQRLATALKGPAFTWYEGLKRSHRLDQKDWPTLKRYFLEHYEKLVTASVLTRSLKEIQMKPTETVAEYSDRCQAVFNEYYDQYVEKSCKMNEVQHASNTPANREFLRLGMETAAQYMMIYMQMTLFEAGLLDHIRLEVATKRYDNLMDLQRAAAEAEASRNTKRVLVSAVEEADDDDELDDSSCIPLTEEDYETVATVYRSRGKKMPAFYKKRYNQLQLNNRQNQPNSAAVRLSKKEKADMECWHCGKKGHLISECRGKAAGKPKAPGAGPKNKKVNATDTEEVQVRVARVNSLNF
jgi:uncharacterized protein (DUF1778 family)